MNSSRRRADEILAKMEHNPEGDYTIKDYEKVYMGYGFEKTDEGKHTKYKHRHYKITAFVKRHELFETYAKNAVRDIKLLKEKEAAELLTQAGESKDVQEKPATPKKQNDSRNQRYKGRKRK